MANGRHCNGCGNWVTEGFPIPHDCPKTRKIPTAQEMDDLVTGRAPLRREIAELRAELSELKARDERSIHALAAAMSEYGFLDETWSDADWNRFMDIVRIHMEPTDREYLDSVRNREAPNA